MIYIYISSNEAAVYYTILDSRPFSALSWRINVSEEAINMAQTTTNVVLEAASDKRSRMENKIRET